MLEQNNLKNRVSIYIKSLIAGLAVCLILMFLLSLIMRFTPMTEKWIGYYSLGIVAFSCMFTGITAGYYKRKMGLLNGLIHSIVLLFVLFVIYYFAVENIAFKNMLHIRHLICLACGALGGMIGVNAK
ncbi:MAG: TIGR04086 family membrane protein [Clostridia bacterium]|nr:TIGR04086 family membrane protein [Clostridia bacterium]